MNFRFSRQWERSPFTPQPALWVGCCNTLVPYPDCSPSVAWFENGALLLSCISQESREEGHLLASKQKFKRERSGAAALLFCYPAASMGCVSWRWLSSHSLPPAAAGVSPRELSRHSVKQKVASTFCHTPLVSAIASSHPQDCGCFEVKSVLGPPLPLHRGKAVLVLGMAMCPRHGAAGEARGTPGALHWLQVGSTGMVLLPKVGKK